MRGMGESTAALAEEFDEEALMKRESKSIETGT